MIEENIYICKGVINSLVIDSINRAEVQISCDKKYTTFTGEIYNVLEKEASTDDLNLNLKLIKSKEMFKVDYGLSNELLYNIYNNGNKALFRVKIGNKTIRSLELGNVI